MTPSAEKQEKITHYLRIVFNTCNTQRLNLNNLKTIGDSNNA